MKVKKVIALICLLMMATQMLPVKEIGSMLFGNQINEEIPHCSDSGKDAAFKLLLKGESSMQQFSSNGFLSACIAEYADFASLLPQNHAGDIHTPPPNML